MLSSGTDFVHTYLKLMDVLLMSRTTGVLLSNDCIIFLFLHRQKVSW